MAGDTIAMIEKLVEICREGQIGYRDAAEHTETAELREFFNRQSLERASFAGELESEAIVLGEDNPERTPSLANKLHRAWFDLKQKLSGNDAGILESVEAGEDHAKKQYEEAMHSKLPLNILNIVERQADSVFAAHNKVRTLRNQYKSAA